MKINNSTKLQSLDKKQDCPAFVTTTCLVMLLLRSGSCLADSGGNNGVNSLPVQDLTNDVLSLSVGDGSVPVAGTVTVPYWTGQFTDQITNATYLYQMVGQADPRQFNGTTTVQVDVIPVDLVFSNNNNYTLNGSDVIPGVLASPVFTPSDFSSTPISTGGSGALSVGNVNVQYLDAVMRSEFNQTGTAYHLLLSPNVWPPLTLTVPAGQGGAFVNTRGIPYGSVDKHWFLDRLWEAVHNLNLDPTHLFIFVSKSTVLTSQKFTYGGFHFSSVSHSAPFSGTPPIYTFIWATYNTPGLRSDFQILQPDGTPGAYFKRDTMILTHEVAEWANDPFNNNSANPYLYLPLNTGYSGCGSLVEVGDPVQSIGFVMPGNTFDTNQYSDGYFHLEDEVFLPWFAREDPNVTSQTVQGGPAGRYTFMGNLNPYIGFHIPAAACPQ
jgi:hypothetical protein